MSRLWEIGEVKKVFDAPEWLATVASHVPNKGEQMVRYYGHYSNGSRVCSKGSWRRDLT
jgi:hypothetical protein